ncbi:MAG: cytochrome c biogenesis protein CcsA [Bacteroidales bacterium]|nr:cytochrome c biogenesis protein CcsA [Bacteroidales bacterium]
MKNIVDFLFSTRLMGIVLALFAVSIASATFIENDFGSASARMLVYNAHWFELLLLLGMINLAGHIFTQKLYRKSKFTVFLFHIAFLLILLGAAITRYTGFEGTMAIREGEESQSVLAAGTAIDVVTGQGGKTERKSFPVSFSALGRRTLKKNFQYQDKTFHLSVRSFVPNAYPAIEPSMDGKPVAEFIYSDREGRKSQVITSGEIKIFGNLRLAFDVSNPDTNALILISSGDSLLFASPYPVSRAGMSDQSMTLLAENIPHRLEVMQLYTVQEQVLVLNKYHKQGKVTPKPLPAQNGQSLDAVLLKLTSDRFVKEMILWGKNGLVGEPETIILNNTQLTLTYGSDYKVLPFKLKLNDFKVERYPGSQSPSSFESDITLSDLPRNIIESSRVYMNNVLKYRGYRFYQSSYDPDEKGSILSVNYDLAGTLVTYIGYLLMTLGMLLSLLNKNSRFRKLAGETASLKLAKKGLAALLFLFLITDYSRAQESMPAPSAVAVNKEHAARFGKLLIQDNGGRIEPVNTLSSEVLRKLYRKSDYKGMTPDQVFLGMFADPATWQYEPIIRTTNSRIQKMLGSKGRYYSFASFFRDNNYILHDHVESAFRKKPVYRSKFDNEVIRLDERVNIAYLVFTGEILRILPVPGDSTHTWYSQPGITGKVHTQDSVFTNHIISYYIQDVQQSLKRGDWKSSDEIIRSISSYQQKFAQEIIPPPVKVKLEILLNKADVFSRISKYYGLTGFVLLLLQFTGLFFTKLKLKVPVIIATVFIIILFAVHSTGLGLRWYVSGHAPWSNGYEALIYIAWATVLAGLAFASKSSITLSATSILAFLVLNTAHLSWMDPQITNLVPVLKSYWLVIHVATITASYGFLALGSLLAFINLLLMSLQTTKTREYLYLTVRELTNTIEMTLIIGLYLLTIGCFLGAVWANESWGRYWGWDPKETWALVSILIYAFILHMRMIPGLKGTYAFNLGSLLGIGTILMTYFGVNYYLSGLHSYAQGDPLPVPAFVYYTLLIIFCVALMAYFNNRRLNRGSE